MSSILVKTINQQSAKWNDLHASNELQHQLQKLVSTPSFLVFSFVTSRAFVVF